MAKIRVEEDLSSAASSASEVESLYEKDEFDAEEMVLSDGSEGSCGTDDSGSEQESIQQPASKKQKKKTFNPEALASAFQTVLRQKLPSEKEKDADTQETPTTAPILSRRKAVERNIEEEELEKKAKKILRAQIREAQDAMHVSNANLPETLNYERSLRKLATRGVVHLFNSIRTAQISKEEEALSKRQAKLDQVYDSLPLATKGGSSEQPDTYFEFLMQQQQQLRQQQ